MGREQLQGDGKDKGRPIGKHPALIVLEGLLIGLTIELGGQDYAIGIDPVDNQECFSVPVYWNGEDRLLASDMFVDTFLGLCSRLSEDELTIIGANIALNKINQSEER